MKLSVSAILACLAASLFAATVLGGEPKVPPAWGLPQVFSDMSYGSESGDIGGMEVMLIPGDGDFWALVQIAEGVPKGPVLVKAELKESKLEFTLPADRPAYENYGKFTGEISDAGLKLWLRGEEYGFLKRQCDQP